LKNKLFSLFR